MSIIAPFVMHRKRGFASFLAIAIAVFCLAGVLSQTVQAENTYVITDGKAVMPTNSTFRLSVTCSTWIV